MNDPRLNAALTDSPLGEQSKTIRSRALPSVRLLAEDRDAATRPTPHTRLGGHPDLPPGVAWPTRGAVGKARPLSFLAQIDLASLPRAPLPKELPKDGLLSFFYDAEEQPWGDVDEADAIAVLYTPVGMDLEAREPPEGVDAPTTFRRRLLRGHPEATLPEVFLSEDLDPADLGLSDESLGDAEQKLRENIRIEGTPLHRIGGFADNIQAPPLDSESAKSTVLLLQLDTDDADSGTGWMWCDSGTLYFLIDKADLAAGNFAAVRYELQSC